MKKETIIPKNRNLILLPIEETEEVDGIYMGKVEDFICGRGEVIAVQDNCKDYSVGDKVIYRLSMQSAFVLNGEKVHIVKEDAVDGVLKT